MNHLSTYLSTTNPTHRKELIRSAKFPEKFEVSSYGNVKSALRKSLQKPDFGKDDLEFLIGKLEAEALRKDGQAKNNSLLQARAVKKFQETFSTRRFARYSFGPPAKMLLPISGVKVNVSLDATLSQETESGLKSGAIALHYSFSKNRGDERDHQRAVAALVYWSLESGQVEPLPRLCMAVDLAISSVMKAPSGYERFRARTNDACSEIAARWSEVEPPPEYDGPDWR